jgi:hypothetical protein
MTYLDYNCIGKLEESDVVLITIFDGLHLVFVLKQYVGRFIRDIDGYFCYDPSIGDGLWSEYELRLIVDKLRELNRPWNDHLDKYFASERKKEQMDSFKENEQLCGSEVVINHLKRNDKA